MIVFDPLWETLKKRGYTTYTLRFKFKMSHETVQRLQKNQSVTTFTLNRLCNLLNCPLEEIIRYIPDPPSETE